MKTALVLCTLLAIADAFGVAPVPRQRAATTALAALISEDDMTPAQKEIAAIREKWNAIRHLTKEEAALLDDEDSKAAHTRYFERYDQDMTKMQEIASKLVTMLEPPRVEKKTKNQRKRDKWAKVQARVAFRAAAAESAVKKVA